MSWLAFPSRSSEGTHLGLSLVIGVTGAQPMSNDRYDVIVIGSGPGGASLALRLAATGKRILILEHGDYLKREPANWDARAVFVDGRYQANDRWYDERGNSFHPGLHYVV